MFKGFLVLFIGLFARPHDVYQVADEWVVWMPASARDCTKSLVMVNEVPESVEGCPLQCLERLSFAHVVRLHVIEEITPPYTSMQRLAVAVHDHKPLRQQNRTTTP